MEKPNLCSICRAWKCKRRLTMFWIPLLKLGFTLKNIDFSVFSSLQRYFLHLPDFLLSSKASAPAKRTLRKPHTEKEIESYWSIKKEVQSKADHNNVYCFFKTIFRLALPAAFFNKPDNMQDRRPRFLQLISFSNLSMPENLVMTSPYSVYPYRLWGRVKKTSVGWGREFQTYVCCISFWRIKKKQNKKQNKTKSKKKKRKKKKYLEAANRVASFYAPFMLRSSFV